MDTATRSAIDPYFLASHQGETLECIGFRMLADDEKTGSRILAGVVTNPGPGGPPMHTHLGRDELYFVLEGRYRFRMDGASWEGGPGAFAFVPGGVSHTFESVGPERGRLLALTTPGFSGFLKEMNELARHNAEQGEMEELFRRYDSRID